MGDLLLAIGHSWPFVGVLVFVAGYPLLTACVWIGTSIIYAWHRERSVGDFYDIPDTDLPKVTLLVPAYREGSSLDPALERLHHLDYPSYEVLVVDDGSPDDTAEVARGHVRRDDRFRLLRKTVNEGKAMAMNDAMAVVTGQVVVVVDADAGMHPRALRYIAAHFVRLPRVGAVTGNPRVANRTSVLTELQTLEFTSIVSVLRRAQVVWGRILTVSGVISAFRTSALEDVGLFDPTMVTEDIDVTWRLQRRFYDIRYEPRALVDMTVPASFAALWVQRRRWATGLVQVLRRHWRLGLSWRCRRQWPVLAEATLSILWAHAFVTLLAFWTVCVLTGTTPVGASPFPNGWGMLIGSLCLAQIGVGVLLDSRYDRSVRRSFLVAPIYPLFYWALMAAVTVRSTLPALARSGRQSLAIWHTPRTQAAVVAAQRAAGDPETLSEAA